MQKSHRSSVLVALLGALFLTACIGPSGRTVAEKRESAMEMRDRAMAALYDDHPHLKEKVEKAAGYAVFSNFSIHPGFLSFASGYGVLTNKATDQVTHQKWLRLTIGPGLAVKGIYVLVTFDDADTVERFESAPWVAGGQAEASFVFGDFGGGWEKAWAFNRHVEAFYTTHTGVALELELIGIGKVSNNKKLNAASAP